MYGKGEPLRRDRACDGGGAGVDIDARSPVMSRRTRVSRDVFGARLPNVESLLCSESVLSRFLACRER